MLILQPLSISTRENKVHWSKNPSNARNLYKSMGLFQVSGVRSAGSKQSQAFGSKDAGTEAGIFRILSQPRSASELPESQLYW